MIKSDEPINELQETLAVFSKLYDTCTCPNHFHPWWFLSIKLGTLGSQHYVSPFVEELVDPWLSKPANILIAGAADTASLDLLSAMNSGNNWRFTIVDLCEAPLQQTREFAAQNDLALNTERCDVSAASFDEQFDLIFVFYTMSFMEAEQQLSFLLHMKRALARDGKMICALKYSDQAKADDALREQALEEKHQTALCYFADYPEVHPHLEAIWHSNQGNRRETARREALMHEADIKRLASQTGLRVTESVDISHLKKPWKGDGDSRTQLVLSLEHDE